MSTMRKYHGITYAFPKWLLPMWKRFMCCNNMHLFDEVVASGDEHYLICDACELIVNIKSIDTQWINFNYNTVLIKRDDV